MDKTITEEQLAEWKVILSDRPTATVPQIVNLWEGIPDLIAEVRRQREEIERLYADLRTEQAKIVHTEIRSFPACNSSDKP